MSSCRRRWQWASCSLYKIYLFYLEITLSCLELGMFYISWDRGCFDKVICAVRKPIASFYFPSLLAVGLSWPMAQSKTLSLKNPGRRSGVRSYRRQSCHDSGDFKSLHLSNNLLGGALINFIAFFIRNFLNATIAGPAITDIDLHLFTFDGLIYHFFHHSPRVF